MLLFVPPSNPTGAVYLRRGDPRDRRHSRAAPALGPFADEIYEHLVYDGIETGSLPVLCPEPPDHTVVVHGVAKTAMTGWRVGWMIGPTDLVKAATNLQSHATSNVAERRATRRRAALEGDLTAVDEMKVAFAAAVTINRPMLNEIDGVVCPMPGGAFYAYPSVKGPAGQEHGGRRIDHLRRPRRVHPRPGRGRYRPGRGVRLARLPAALPRPR